MYLYIHVCLCVPSLFSCIRLFATLWTVACQALLSMGFPRQEYWNGLPFPPPGDLPDPGMEPTSPASPSPALAGSFFTTEPLGKHTHTHIHTGKYIHTHKIFFRKSC